MKCVAMKIACHVEPRLVVVVSDLDDERIPLPMSTGVAHPEINSFRARFSVCVDQAKYLRPLESDRDVVAGLKNMKRELHVHDPRDAGHEAFGEGISSL